MCALPAALFLFTQMISPLKADLFVDQDTGESCLCPNSGLDPPRIAFLEQMHQNTLRSLSQLLKEMQPSTFQIRTMRAVNLLQPPVSPNQLDTGQLINEAMTQYPLTLKVGKYVNGCCLPGICTLSLVLHYWNQTNEKATASCE